MAEDSRVFPDLKDIETKVGRKVPESLARSLVGGKRHEEREKTATSTSTCKRRSGSADVKRLEGKMLFLRQEMVRKDPGGGVPGSRRGVPETPGVPEGGPRGPGARLRDRGGQPRVTQSRSGAEET